MIKTVYDKFINWNLIFTVIVPETSLFGGTVAEADVVVISVVVVVDIDVVFFLSLLAGPL